jgi:hypothetical protein
MDSSLIDTLAPEKRLLVHCARMRMRPEIAEAIRALVAGGLDWDALLSGADQNAIVPLLERQLRAAAADLLPVAQLQRLSEAGLANTLRSLSLTAAMIEILRLFHEREIVAVPYKGPVLAAQAYGDVSLRQFDDVDIILPHRDMVKAHEGMLRLGYAAKFPARMSPSVNAPVVPGEYKYYSEARGAIVELHTERTLRHFSVMPDLDALSSRAMTISLGGLDVRTLAQEDSLLAICVHGSKDFWGRISWIADVSELVQSHPLLDWRLIRLRAKSLGVERMLHVGLILAARILGLPLPDEIAGSVKEDGVAEAIAVKLERSLLSTDSAVLGARGRFHVRRRTVPGFLAGWRYALRLTLAPAEEDWRMLRLPRPLAPFYILLRPFRLLRKYGRSHEEA